MNAIRHGHATHQGRERDANQDNYAVAPELRTWMIADGMGGHQGGEVASALAIRSIIAGLRLGAPLDDAIRRAHHDLLEAHAGSVRAMGTTIVALQVHDNEFEVDWVGDSRAYIWDSMTLRRLTRDHSLVQELLDAGAIDQEGARQHPERAVITQALGATAIDEVSVGVTRGELHQGEQILLCSDGLVGEIGEAAIARIMARDTTEQQKVESLVAEALAAGGHDNITAVVCSAPRDAPRRIDTARRPVHAGGSTRPVAAVNRSAWRARAFLFGLAAGAAVFAAVAWLIASQPSGDETASPVGAASSGEMTRMPADTPSAAGEVSAGTANGTRP